MATLGRPNLTRRLLIDTAARLLDEVGLDGLTVRRLAAELGVRSPALYWHIRTKQELLDGIADAIVRAPGMGPPVPGESWRDWLYRRARAYRRSMLAHRDGARVVANARWLGPDTIRVFDAELAALAGHGFTPVLALRTITAITNYITGFVLREQTERPPPSAETSADAGMDALARLLDGGTSAPLPTAIRAGGSPLGEEAFEHGLRLLIDGTAALLRQEGR